MTVALGTEQEQREARETIAAIRKRFKRSTAIPREALIHEIELDGIERALSGCGRSREETPGAGLTEDERRDMDWVLKEHARHCLPAEAPASGCHDRDHRLAGTVRRLAALGVQPVLTEDEELRRARDRDQ